MADRTAPLDDLLQDGLIIDDEPEGAQLDLEASVNSWIADLGGKDGAKIMVYRQKPDTKGLVYIDGFNPQEKDAGDLMHQLRNEYGGGRFHIHLRADGKIAKRAMVDVEPPPKSEETNNSPYDPVAMLRELRADDKTVTGGDDNTMRLMFSMMQSQADNQAKMMTAFAEAISSNQNTAPPPPTMTELVSALAAVKALDGDGKGGNNIDLFIKGVELAKDLSGAGGDTNMMDVLKSSISAFGGTLTDAMAAQAQPPALPGAAPAALPGPSRAALPAPGATAPGQPEAAPSAPGGAQVAPTDAARKLAEDTAKLAPLARMVIGWAEQNRDPYTYAGVLIDELGPDNAFVWFCTKEGADTLLSTFPDAKPHTAWLVAVGEAIAEITHPDDDTPPSGHDDPPPIGTDNDAPHGLPDVSAESETATDDADPDAHAHAADPGGTGGDQNHAAIDGESSEASENTN